MLIFIAILTLSCQKLPTDNSDIADLPLTLNLQPAFDSGFNVTQVLVTITCGEFTSSLALTIDGNVAYGTFYDLQPGIYNINVEVFEDDLLIATGNGTGEVVAGETTSVNIELVFVPLTGNLTIVVDWTNQLPEYPQRILFIGNSITYFNGGVDEHTMNLANNINPDLGIECNSITGGGWTLEMHYNNPATIDEITNGNYDMVILQEMTSRPVNDPDLFYFYASALDSVITDSGAETAFFFSWPFESEFDTMIEQQAAAYNYIGQQLNAPVFPIARAWQYSLQHNPEIELYLPDGNHPSVQGTYLACCAFYAFIWNESPIGATYINDPAISDNERDALQQNAWNTYLIYR